MPSARRTVWAPVSAHPKNSTKSSLCKPLPAAPHKPSEALWPPGQHLAIPSETCQRPLRRRRQGWHPPRRALRRAQLARQGTRSPPQGTTGQAPAAFVLPHCQATHRPLVAELAPQARRERLRHQGTHSERRNLLRHELALTRRGSHLAAAPSPGTLLGAISPWPPAQEVLRLRQAWHRCRRGAALPAPRLEAEGPPLTPRRLLPKAVSVPQCGR